MNVEEYAKQQIKKSAEAATHFWNDVKSRYQEGLREREHWTETGTSSGVRDGSTCRVLDIQTISEGCIDLLMVRTYENPDFEQMDHWRFVVEKRLFRKPRIRFYCTEGPSLTEFLSDDRNG